jgi:uncharacterized protein (DUF58 family)
MLAFMALTGLLGWLNLRGLEASVAVPDELYRGVETLVTISVVNGKRLLPSFLLRAGFNDKGVTFFLVERRTTAALPLVCSFPHRGVHRSLTLSISSPFPVNFFVRRLLCNIEAAITVFPTPVPCRTAQDASGVQRDGEHFRQARGYDGEIAWIADYTGVEPLKQVHWRLTARHGELKVKGYEATGAEPVLIDVDSLAARNGEEALGCATYLVNSLMRRNRPVGLKLGNTVIPPGMSRPHRLLLLRELADHAAG